MPVRYTLSSVWVRVSIFSQLSIIQSIIQYVGLFFFFQLTHSSCDDWDNIYTLSYHDHQIGSMNYYPLLRVRSWNNGVRCMSFYILTMQTISAFQTPRHICHKFPLYEGISCMSMNQNSLKHHCVKNVVLMIKNPYLWLAMYKFTSHIFKSFLYSITITKCWEFSPRFYYCGCECKYLLENHIFPNRNRKNQDCLWKKGVQWWQKYPNISLNGVLLDDKVMCIHV